MKTIISSAPALSFCVLLIAAGCRQQPAANTELEKAAAALDNAAPAPPAAPDAPPVPVPGVQMKQAIDSYKSGKLDDTVTQLHKLRATPTLTPQQLLALNDAMAAIMGDIYARAAKGDSRAAQAVKQYERMQNERR